MLPPRPLVGGGARLKAMSAARRSSGLRFKHSAQIVRVGGGQVYDRQAGPGNSRPGLVIKPRVLVPVLVPTPLPIAPHAGRRSTIMP